MSRVHDVGGQAGFGPVPVTDDGQPFHADWEARVYALSGAPTTAETALTSGYLLVEARSPLPEPTRRRPERY